MGNQPRSVEKLFSLKNKVAIVTGAAGQLGGEFVLSLLGAGAHVAGFDVRPDNPKSRLRRLRHKNFMMVPMDITDRRSVQAAMTSVLSRFKHIDVLVNNAAIDNPPGGQGADTGPFETYPDPSWDMVMKVNLKGMFLCCQVIGGHMARTGGGSIINIASLYGMLSPDQRIYEDPKRKTPFYKPMAYAVSKAGVLNLTRYLATYWASKNVRVNTLTFHGVYNRQPETFVKKYVQRVPMGRMARPDEYNGAVLFLASDASSYMTGSNLVMDGGTSAW